MLFHVYIHKSINIFRFASTVADGPRAQMITSFMAYLRDHGTTL